MTDNTHSDINYTQSCYRNAKRYILYCATLIVISFTGHALREVWLAKSPQATPFAMGVACETNLPCTCPRPRLICVLSRVRVQTEQSCILPERLSWYASSYCVLLAMYESC